MLGGAVGLGDAGDEDCAGSVSWGGDGLVTSTLPQATSTNEVRTINTIKQEYFLTICVPSSVIPAHKESVLVFS
jgi:hypothetical protein